MGVQIGHKLKASVSVLKFLKPTVADAIVYGILSIYFTNAAANCGSYNAFIIPVQKTISDVVVLACHVVSRSACSPLKNDASMYTLLFHALVAIFLLRKRPQ